MNRQHKVSQGECLSLIAHNYGFAQWETVYGDPDNADFRRKRPDPNLIYPGDVLSIPDREGKEISKPTGASHRFELKRPRKHLRLYLENTLGEPIPNRQCRLEVSGKTFELTSGADGLLELEIPVDATDATLTLDGSRRTLRIGDLNPVHKTVDESVSGVQGRLRNLGYHPGAVDGVVGSRTAEAIRAFQADNGLEPTGAVDDALLEKLLGRHRC